MTYSKSIFETLVLMVDHAIETEVGEQKEFKPETEQILSDFQKILIELLDLPKDHHL